MMQQQLIGKMRWTRIIMHNATNAYVSACVTNVEYIYAKMDRQVVTYIYNIFTYVCVWIVILTTT